MPQVEAVDQFRAYQISYNGRPVTLGGSDRERAGSTAGGRFLSGANTQSIFNELARVSGHRDCERAVLQTSTAFGQATRSR